MKNFTVTNSPVGNLKIEEENGYIISIQLTDADCTGEHKSPLLAEADKQLAEYFEGKRSEFALPLRAEGTEFQKAVWNEMCAIPYGSTLSYGALAENIGHKGAVRAVGTACGRNPIAIVVPCHRVVASSSIGGYAYGTEMKQHLLSLEQSQLRYSTITKNKEGYYA